MSNANRDVTTARNTQRPTLIVGMRNAPCPSTFSTGRCDSQGLTFSVWRSNHPTTSAMMAAKTSNEGWGTVYAPRSARLADRLRCSGGVELLRSKIRCVGGLLEALGLLTRWLVLRYEVLRCAGYAVIVSPAIDHR